MTADDTARQMRRVRRPNSGDKIAEFRRDPVVELTALFANQGFTAPVEAFRVSGRVRTGTTCRLEVLSAIDRLDGVGPRRWHTREEITQAVLKATRRYSVETIRRILCYDLVGRSTSHHVVSRDLERVGSLFRRL